MTTELKVRHTPAPWASIPDMDGDHAISALRGDKLIAVTDGWTGGNSTLRERSEDEANANLIAAAPEMADALQRFMDATGVLFFNLQPQHFNPDQRHIYEAWQQAKAALKKAGVL